MNPELTVMLPPGLDPKVRAALEADLRATSGVEDAFDGTVRGTVDPATVKMVIELGSSAIGLVTIALPIVEKIVGLLKKHGISKAKIVTADGVTIETEGATAGELETLAAAVSKSPRPRTS